MTGEHPPANDETHPRHPSPLGRLATLILLLRPVAAAIAVGAIIGYLLRSPLLGAGAAGALLGVTFWWNDIHRPARKARR